MSLIAWYPLNGNMKNYGIDGIDLSNMGSVPFNNGKIGQAATFSNNAANCLHRTDFKLIDNFSWCSWVKMTATTSTNQFILSEGRDYEKFGISVVIDSYGYLRILYGTNTNVGIQTLTANTWYHIVVTINSIDGIKIYINGSLVKTSTYIEPDYTYSSNRFTIGKMSYSYANTSNYFPFNGQINDVRIYDHCLSAKEVKEISKGLILHYPMNQIDGVIGGKNLIANSATMNKLFSTAGGYAGTRIFVEDEDAICGQHLQITCTTAGNGFYFSVFPKTDDKIGKTYTWSVWLKASTSQTGTLGHECGGTKTVTITTEWQKFTHTWTFTDNTYSAFVCYPTFAVGEILYWRDFKIEEGSVATPWTPAPEDGILCAADNIIYDISGYSNNGIVTEDTCPAWSDDSVVGSGSYKFDTSMNIVNNNGIVLPTDCYTISYWIKFTDLTNIIDWATTFTIGSSANSVRNNIHKNKSTMGIYMGNTIDNYCFSITEDVWYHIVNVFTPTTIYAYQNGVKKLEQSGTFTLSTDGSIVQVNGRTYLTDYATNSKIADFRIYATALSTSDIKELYQTRFSLADNGTLFCSELIEEDSEGFNANGNLNTNSYTDDNTESAMRIGSDYIATARLIEN